MSDVTSQALSKMQTLLNDTNITWRSSQQKMAMHSVLECQKDVVVILATGSGKSMLAIVPSLLETCMVTILVLPLNSLIMDYERRLTAMHVPYQVYQTNKDLNLQDNLVMVSADKSQTPNWRSALADLARRKQIARIVVDEAHIPLVAKSYRKTLEHFYNIRSEPVQLVLLTATLPPAFMPQLIKTYHLLTDAVIYRQGTNRPELKYVLKKTAKESELSTCVQAVVQESMQTWQPQDRALVFTPSISMCMELAQDTNWHYYVGDKEIMTGTDRKEAYTAWIHGHGSKVMIATSAFSTGNDYPHVRLVVYMDKPFNMLEYIQGQGRGGRDGMPAVCHTIVPNKSWKECNNKDKVERSNEQAIYDHLYLYGAKCCLRYGITLYTDGMGVGCHQDKINQICSVCSQDEDHCPQEIQMANMPRHKASMSTFTGSTTQDMPSSFTEASNQVRQLRAQQEYGILGMAEHLQRELQSLLRMCCICLIHPPSRPIGQHNLMECPSLEEHLNATWTTYKQWRQRLQYHKHHSKICFICHVPQITDSLHPTFTKAKKGDKVECEYSDIIAPLAFAIYHHMILRSHAERYFGVTWSNMTMFTNWLMDVPRKDRHSNLIDLFLWYIEMEK